MKQMGINKIVTLCSAGCLALVAFIFFTGQDGSSQEDSLTSNAISIAKRWNLPSALDEISGIAHIGDSRIAAVQDEGGIIFIYNLGTSEIEEEVQFAGSGDFEGISVAGNTAYVLRNDGNLFRIKNFRQNPEFEEFSNDFPAQNNFEGLFYDNKKGELLLAIKGEDPYSEDYKGIYAVNPNTMEVNPQPSYKLNFDDTIFDGLRKEDLQDTYFPSEISRDPLSGNLLVLEAETPRLLILDSEGNPLELHQLDEKNFPQPEGLTFDEEGNLYISNEGNPATIYHVNLKKK